MAKRYITSLLTDKLGAYLNNLDSTDIQFTMSEALLQMENVVFKEDALTKLKLPVQIKHGLIRKLDVSILKVSSSFIGASSVANYFFITSLNHIRRN